MFTNLFPRPNNIPPFDMSKYNCGLTEKGKRKAGYRFSFPLSQCQREKIFFNKNYVSWLRRCTERSIKQSLDCFLDRIVKKKRSAAKRSVRLQAEGGRETVSRTGNTNLGKGEARGRYQEFLQTALDKQCEISAFAGLNRLAFGRQK